MIARSWTFAHDKRAARLARSWVRTLLADEGLVPGTMTGLGDVELLVSELVTNAVLHGQPPHELRVVLDGRRVEISVTDRSRARPVVRTPLLTDTHGRGMALVAALADGWGVEPEPAGGKAVWFRLVV